MNTKILSKDKDPMGAAILDYQKSGRQEDYVCSLLCSKRTKCR